MKIDELNNLDVLFEAPDTVDLANPIEDDQETDTGDANDTDDIDDSETTTETDESETEEVDANPVYNILRDYDIVPELENPTEEQLREHLTNLGPSRVSAFFSTKPSRFKDLAEYVLAKEDVTDEDMDAFYTKYLQNKTSLVEITSPDDARKYLESAKEFTDLYDDPDDLKEALDLLEDKDKLVTKAKTLQEKKISSLQSQTEAEKKATIKAAEDAKVAKLEASKQFASKIQEELKSLSWKDEQKQKAVKAASQDNINKVWSELVQNPKGYLQFANLLTYFKDGTFDSLYDVLEGKQNSKKLTEREKAIAKDTLGSLLGKSKQTAKAGGLEEMFSPA